MRPDDLIRMANQIAMFFAPYPEADAVEGVRDHLVKFWDPQMRRTLLAIEATSERTVVLHPLVVEAVGAMRRANAHGETGDETSRADGPLE